MQTCVDGACKCGENSDCKATDLVDTCNAGECSCQGATCNTDVSDTCTAGMGCTCGSGAACTGNLKCVSGSCACSANEDCTGLTDTCDNGGCKCGAADCDTSISSVCTGGVCKCGADDACGADATLPKCLEKETATAPMGDGTNAKCQVFKPFLSNI